MKPTERRISPWPLGIDHRSADTALPAGALRAAVNVTIDREGHVTRRLGYRRVAALTGAHSLWASSAGTFCALGATLCRIVREGDAATLVELTDLRSAAPVGYASLNDETVFANTTATGIVAADFGVRALSVPLPVPPNVASDPVGGLPAGRYGVVVVGVDARGAEGGASELALAEVAEGGGIRLAGLATVAGVMAWRVYRTPPNGDALFRAADVPVGMTSFLVGAGDLGPLCRTRGLEPLPGGPFLLAWKGRLLAARGNTVYYSEPLRYGLYAPGRNFVTLDRRIVGMAGVEGGVFVLTKGGVVFLAGADPHAWTVVRTGGGRPIPGTAGMLPASMLLPEAGIPAGELAVWLAETGYVLGMPDGRILEPQATRLRLPLADRGSLAVQDRRVTAIAGDANWRPRLPE